MEDIQHTAAENRRGKKDRRKNHWTKMYCPHLLRRAAIKKKKDKKPQDENGLPYSVGRP